jgi:spermidine/putrescine-binding protein
MTKGLPDYIVSIKGLSSPPSVPKVIWLHWMARPKNATKKDLATKFVNDVTVGKSAKNQMTIEESK